MNPLVSDPLVDFLLEEVLDVGELCRLPAFAHHGRETIGPYLDACRRVAREVLFPAYREIDAQPPRLEGGRVVVHPKLRAAWGELVELGVISATWPAQGGGHGLPLAVGTLANAYLMAGNLSAYAYAGLTSGAAHLIEAFGTPGLKARYLEKLVGGQWTGTMALTEPAAGSSLADLTTRAHRTEAGHWLISGSKLFISGGDHDLTENVVHLVLARIEGAPPGTRGISLFVVPRLRPSPTGLIPNDVSVTGLIHKIGWRGLPSLALAFGEEGDCRGELVGEPNEGLKAMFQMMNEARIMVGVNAAATASVAYHQALAYARERRQGRPLGQTDPRVAQTPLVEHPDVRRMLLRQKAIVEGSFALLGLTARFADLAAHAVEAEARARARLLVDLLTPIAKTFPAEWGFEANALALQVHGGYGYSSEYLPEAWLRDQKLNSIHEGTTGIQGLDLLGRKVVAGGGAALTAFLDEAGADLERAGAAGLEVDALKGALAALASVTATLTARGAAGDLEGMLGHSADFMTLASITVVGWVWAKLATRAATRTDGFGRGLVAAWEYWSATELTRVPALATLCESGERSYLALRDEWL